MKKAKKTEANTIEWDEQCFCEIPLNHERTTVWKEFIEKKFNFSQLNFIAINTKKYPLKIKKHTKF
jgi:hypothetical protein